MKLEKVSRAYTTIAIIVFNTLLILVCLNLAIFAYGMTNSEVVTPPTPTIASSFPLTVYDIGPLNYGFEKLDKIYYYMEDPNIVKMLLETWSIQRICDDDAFFREEPFNGSFVHVDLAGFRWGDAQAEWKAPAAGYTVFIFGGSTTFGYGVTDNLTIPSYVQYYLRQELGSDQINVYNFGRAGYFSLQERMLFEALIEDGIVPDLAIFIDGLNEFAFWDGKPSNGGTCLERNTSAIRWRNTLGCRSDEYCTPLQSMVTNLTQDETQPFNAARLANPLDALPVPPDDPDTNTQVIENWLRHKRAIEELAQSADIKVLFVMQPVPSYAYDLQYHLFVHSINDSPVIARTHYGYALWEDLYNDPSADWTDNTLNLTHLGEDNQGSLYVDSVHYAFGFMDEIGAAIVEALIERHILDK